MLEDSDNTDRCSGGSSVSGVWLLLEGSIVTAM